MPFFGRRMILTDQAEITRGNVLEVLEKALSVHEENKSEIETLYKIYKGEQDILDREKECRPEICNKIVENHAQEIVSFKVGYFLGRPIQYISRVQGDSSASEIAKLNAFAAAEEMSSKNVEVAEWNHICGTAYKMVLPDAEADVEQDEAPFEVLVPDPRTSFIVYLNSLSKKPVMSVTYVEKADGSIVYSCYTEDRYFEISDDGAESKIIDERAQSLGIPMVEYPHNRIRQGAFEVVIGLLNAINSAESNRLDGIEQFVQALMVFHNVDITATDFDELRERGAIKVKDASETLKGDIKYLVAELNQDQTQTLKDDLYENILLICGMPNRNGGSSTSDTGAAVEMRDGWSAAEVRAKASEDRFRASEKIFLKKVLKICSDMGKLDVLPSAIEISFPRQVHENVMEKVTVLTTLLGCRQVAPELAFAVSELFEDPAHACEISKEYIEEERQRNEELAASQQRAGNQTGAGSPADPEPRTQRGNRNDEK